jgi:predicted nucleotidyltransferase
VRVSLLFHADAAERGQIVKALAARLAGDPIVRFAYLHGSFLEARGFHDIDVGVSLSSERVGRETETALQIASELSRLVDRPVDVRVLDCAPVTFRFHALGGQLLTCRDEEALSAMLEDTMRRYFDMAPVLQRATIDLVAP